MAPFARREQTPLGMMSCPSRRSPLARPFGALENHQPPNCGPLAVAAKGDYAINGGEVYTPSTGIGNYDRKLITVADIVDGLSNTYLVGEKYLWPEGYETSLDGGDDDTMYWGPNHDVLRWVALGPIACPRQDQSGVSDAYIFGSAPRQRLLHRPLRRLRSPDQLFDRRRDPPPAGQPQRRPDDRRPAVLSRCFGLTPSAGQR